MNYKEQLNNQRRNIEKLCHETFRSYDKAREACEAVWNSVVSAETEGNQIDQILSKVNVLAMNIIQANNLLTEKPSFIHRLHNLFKWEPTPIEFKLKKIDIVWKQCNEVVNLADEAAKSVATDNTRALKAENDELKVKLDNAYTDKTKLQNENKRLKEQLSTNVKKPATDEPQVPLSRFEDFVADYQRILAHSISMKDEEEAKSLKNDVIMLINSEGYDVVDYDNTNNELFNIKEGKHTEKTREVYPTIIRVDDGSVVKKGLVYKPAKH